MQRTEKIPFCHQTISLRRSIQSIGSSVSTLRANTPHAAKPIREPNGAMSPDIAVLLALSSSANQRFAII